MKNFYNKLIFFSTVLLSIFLTSTVGAQTTETFTSTTTWTCPAGVTSITAHCIGGGGGGGHGDSGNDKDGGGGGAYHTVSSIAVTPGTGYTITVGTGGAGGTVDNAANRDGKDGTASTATFDAITITANAGKGGQGHNSGFAKGLGGAAGTYKGGDGANGANSRSGGGGGGAGSTGAGADASGRNAGAGATVGGGAGGNGNNSNQAAGIDGSNRGGGGGGGTKNRDGGDGADGIFQIVYTVGAGGAYCDNSSSNTTYYIDNFSTTGGVANITNNSNGTSGTAYSDYTGMTVSQYTSSSVNFSIDMVGTSYTVGYGIWVDWNQDGDFNDANEAVYNSGAYLHSTTGSFSVPAGALTGSTRMRVVSDWFGSTPVACGGDAYTECEDYTFTVLALTPCVTPTAQATALNLSVISASQIDGSFTAASPAADEYLVVRSTSSTLSSGPVDATAYSAGDALGGGTVVQSSSSTTFSTTCLDENTQYYYFVFAYNNACSGGPLYKSPSLSANATTTTVTQPSALNLSVISSYQIDGSFTAGTGSPEGYVIVHSTSATLSGDPTDGTTYTAGDALGGGSVIQVSALTTFSDGCIAAGTQHYYFIYSYYKTACAGGPYYIISSPLSGNETTTVGATGDKSLPYSHGFDSQDGWDYDGLWQRGDQTNDTYGPPSGRSGNSVAGTVINGDYAVNDNDSYLTAPSFDLTGSTAPMISFWMDMEAETGDDGGTVQLRVNSCTWITVDRLDPGYGGLAPNNTDVDGLENAEDGWTNIRPAGEWALVTLDLFNLTTTGLSSISNSDIVEIRFWFGSDAFTNNYAGWYIDDFSIYDPAVCVEPTNQPTGLTLAPSLDVISGSFTAATDNPDEYLVVMSTSTPLGATPVDGTYYTAGNAIGSGTVVQSSSTLDFLATGLTSGTQYYFYIFSYNNLCTGEPDYLTTNPLTGNTSTLNDVAAFYCEDFEGGSAGWDMNNGTRNWSLETPTASDEPEGDHTTGTGNCMVTEGLNNYQHDKSYILVSPAIDMTGKTGTYMEFWMWLESESSPDGGFITVDKGPGGEVKIASADLSIDYDGNLTGTNNPYAGEAAWKSTNKSWRKVRVNLSNYDCDGRSGVVFYFKFGSDQSISYAGWAIDDVCVYSEVAPTIAMISPATLFEDKGKTISIYGQSVGNPTSVTLGGVAGTVTTISTGEISVDFPAGSYIGNSLIVTNGAGSDNTTATINTRNLIPVDASVGPNEDTHQSISSAVDGLSAWYGVTAFSAGDLPGAKVIEVNNGTYTTMSSNSTLNPDDATNTLTIQPATGHQPIVNATGNPYGFDLDIDNLILTGFSVYGATSDNIRSQGNDCEISYNKSYDASLNGISAYQTSNVHHNLSYDNTGSGISITNSSNAIVENNTSYGNGGAAGELGYTREVDLGSSGIYNWEYDAGWTQIVNTADDATYQIDFGGGNALPFDFSFWGTDYSAATDLLGISSNGILNLGSINNITYTNTTLSTNSTNDNTLNCFWDDIDADSKTTADGQIKYKVKGVAPNRRLIVAWYKRTHYSHRGDTNADDTDVIAVEVKIFETSNIIEFHYNDLIFDPTIPNEYRDWASSATIGIKKNSTTFDQYHFGDDAEETTAEDVDHNLEAIRWSPITAPGSALHIESGSGTIVRNNILYAKQDGSSMALSTGSAGVLASSTYNTYYKGANTDLVDMNGTTYADLATWPDDGIGDIQTDPKFVTAGTDFHIRSIANGVSYHSGEWPPLTANEGSWIDDNDASPCIDAGTGTFDQEPTDNGGVRNQGCYGNTLQATHLSIEGFWTGAVSTDWFNTGNWSDGVVPTGSCESGPGSDGLIPAILTIPGNYPIITGVAEAEDLTIENGAKVTIATNGALTVCGTLTNNPGLTGLIIKSDASGDGSLIHSTPGVLASIERYIQGVNYSYIGSPISVATPAGIGIATTQYYEWDATMHWNGMGGDPYGTPSTIDYAPWSVASGALGVGQGYAYYHETQTLNFNGTVNVADVTLTLNDDGANANQEQGWNLISNPYASALNWNTVTGTGWDNTVEKAIYMFDDMYADVSAHQTNYRYFVPASGAGYYVGTNDATEFIPVGQGFMVRTTADNKNLVIEKEDREHNDVVYYRESPVHPDLLRMNIAGNGAKDETVIRFIHGATLNFDGNYEARKLFPNSSSTPQVYTMNPDEVKTAITTLPALNQSYEVQLGLASAAGNFTYNFMEVNFDDANVYLEDKLTSTTVNIKEVTSYNFDHSGDIDNNRFVLHFIMNTRPVVAELLVDQTVSEDENNFEYLLPQNAFIDNDFADQLAYSAQLADGSILPQWLNFDSETRTFTVSDAEEGEFDVLVRATDLSGEIAEQEFLLTIMGSALSSGTGLSKLVDVYPNPSTGKFTIISSKTFTGAKIKVKDIAGKTIHKSESAALNDAMLDLSKHADGVYFLEIHSEDNAIVRKRIVIRK